MGTTGARGAHSRRPGPALPRVSFHFLKGFVPLTVGVVCRCAPSPKKTRSTNLSFFGAASPSDTRLDTDLGPFNFRNPASTKTNHLYRRQHLLYSVSVLAVCIFVVTRFTFKRLS